MSRPEHTAPPEVYYNHEAADKYHSNSRMIDIQSRMSQRALDLLMLPDDKPCLLLDIGCGSGLSGAVLDEAGHTWIGLDISPAMLQVALDRETSGDMMLSDMGQGFNFRPGAFDGAISISALQWLMNADTKAQKPFQRLKAFFQSLFNSLARGGRAVLQFYPENSDQVETITAAAMRCGFGGGLVIDYPHSTKAKKYFLVLWAGTAGNTKQRLPAALDDAVQEEVNVEGRSGKKRKLANGKAVQTSKEKTLQLKERHRRQGKEVVNDSKYSGRKRKTTW
jgi:18S rRNA (guanine1575-N7)-methyltransferase